jgi:tetratricopeptide (TPR) repeat protein
VEVVTSSLLWGKLSNDPSAWNVHGYSLLMQNNKAKSEKAINSFNNAIRLSQGSMIEAHYNLAQAYKDTGRWMSAKKECRAAIEQAQKQEKMCPLVHNLHGILMKHSGGFKGAESANRISHSSVFG